MANAAMVAQAAEAQAQQVQEIPKEPIPTEHQVLQDIFDSLVRSCSSAANNPVSNYNLGLLYQTWISHYLRYLSYHCRCKGLCGRL